MTGIFIVARLGSTRLSQKHLIKSAGKTFIEWLAARFYFSFRKEIENKEVDLFVVTSEKGENKKFESVFESNPFVHVFYGSDSNIPLRQLQCAEKNDISEIINIDGDDILCSTTAAGVVREKLLKGRSFVKTTGLPLGMNVMGYTTEFLRESLANWQHSVLETGWGKIFAGSKAESVALGEYDLDERLRLTLDYEKDADFFNQIISHFGNEVVQLQDKPLIDYIIGEKIFETNQQLNKVYWQNFNQQQNKEL